MALAHVPAKLNPVGQLSAPYVRDHTRQTATAILWTLFDLGGEFKSGHGYAGRELIEEAVKLGYRIPAYYRAKNSGLSQLLTEMDNGRYGGLIERDTRGNAKKTYSIRLLVDEADLPTRPARLSVQPEANGGPTDPRTTQEPKPKGDDDEPVDPRTIEPGPITTPAVPQTDPAPEPEPDDPQPEPDEREHEENVEVEELTDNTTVERSLSVAAEQGEVVLPKVPGLTLVATEPMDALLMIQQLTMQGILALATQVGQAPAAAPEQGDLDALKAQLGTTLEENQRLRRKLAEASETLQAKVKENEGLRKALMLANGNLKALQDAANQGNDLERKLKNLRDTQRLMATPPTKAGIGNRAAM